MRCISWIVLGASGMALLITGGCAGYAGDVKEVRSALVAGDKQRALQKTNEAMEVEEPDQYPIELESINSLLLLERATIKQGLGSYQSSTLDFRVADQNLEILDVKRDTVGNIGKWIFSGDSGVYKAPPHEKMLLNTLNMLNYLAMGELESARVEARRLNVMQRYLADEESEAEAILGIGNYLAGFTFEQSGRYEQALQQYSSALEGGEYPGLSEVLPRIAGCTNYRNENISALLGESDGIPSDAPCTERDKQTGTLLVLPAMGLAPYKTARRIPIGAAVVIAGAYLAPSQMAQSNEFAVKGLLKWVNFPELTQSRPRFDKVQVTVNGNPINTEYGENISAVVKRSWDGVKGKLMAAAIVRMIARAVAGAATNKAVESGSGKGGLGLLAQVLVEGAMTAADTPDTRSWVTLPASFFLSRVELPAGQHTVSVVFNGPAGTQTQTIDIRMAPGGFLVVPVETMR